MTGSNTRHIPALDPIFDKSSYKMILCRSLYILFSSNVALLFTHFAKLIRFIHFIQFVRFALSFHSVHPAHSYCSIRSQVSLHCSKKVYKVTGIESFYNYSLLYEVENKFDLKIIYS